MRPGDDLSFREAGRETAVLRILRLGLAGCFVGHGAFGIITKAAWVPYFGVVGITESSAWQLMPWVGIMDITVGLLALLWPCRGLLFWAAAWAAWTALLRPLAGEPFWEFLERAGNYGVPLAWLIVIGWRGSPLARLPGSRPGFTATTRLRLVGTLRFTTATLLAGHAGLGLYVHKAALAHLYAATGLAKSSALVPWVGGFEFVLAGLVLTVPRPGLLIAVGAWKLATEALYPLSGAPIWEFVERFGSYTAPLALGLLLTRPPSTEAPAPLPSP